MSGKGRMLQQKFYCQICSKQCKDENGFKCHVNTRTHLANLEEVMKDPDSHISKHSRNFEKGFIEIIKWKYKNQFVSANKVYLEYIKDTSCSHLNATKWGNLTRFIFSMKRKGRFEVEEEGEGKFLVKLIDEESQSFMDLLSKKSELNEDQLKLKDLQEVKEIENQRKIFKVEDPTTINKWYSVRACNEQTNETTEMLGNKRKISINQIVEVDYSQYNLDENESWIALGLIVQVMDIELNSIYKSIGEIIGVDDSNNFIAQVKGTDNSSIQYKIEIDQYYLSPVSPTVGDEFVMLYGPNKHDRCLMTDSCTCEVISSSKKIKNFNLKGCCKLKDSIKT